MSAYDSRILGGTQATQPQYRAPARPPAPAPIRRQGGAPPPPGAPDDYASAQALFQKLLGPEIASLNSLYGDRAKSGMDAITGYTKQLAAALAPLAGQVSGIYSNAEQSQASSDAALRQALAGGGQGLANDLSAKLAAINAPGAQVSDVAGGQAATGVNAGNAGYALGSAELGRLIGTGAAETGLAAKQPGIAGFTGLQKAGQLQQSLQSDLAGKVAGLEGQGPSFVQAQVNATRSERAAAARAAQAQANSDRSYGLSVAKLKDSSTLARQRLDQQGKIAQDRSNQGWQRLSDTERQNSIRNLQSDRNFNLATARYDLSVQKANAAAAHQARLDGGGYTKSQVIQFDKRAGKIAADAWDGVKTTAVDAAGKKITGTTHLGYQEAMTRGLAAGIPLTVMQDALNTYWKAPGTKAPWETKGNPMAAGATSFTGRPLQSYQERQQVEHFFSDDPRAQQAIAIAKQYQGTPYVFGGASPKTGFDCSGLVQYAWGKAGVQVPRTSQQQYRYGIAVDKGALQPGDAVFFVGSDGTRENPGHEAMYIGKGMVIVSPHTGGAVQVVPLASFRDYVGARRFGAVAPNKPTGLPPKAKPFKVPKPSFTMPSWK